MISTDMYGLKVSEYVLDSSILRTNRYLLPSRLLAPSFPWVRFWRITLANVLGTAVRRAFLHHLWDIASGFAEVQVCCMDDADCREVGGTELLLKTKKLIRITFQVENVTSSLLSIKKSANQLFAIY